MRALVPILTIALTACATAPSSVTVAQLHDVCTKIAPSFVEHARCMRETVAEPGFPSRGDSSIELYTAQAAALADRVRNGRMTESEARYEQLALKADLERRRQARADAAGDAALRAYNDSERARRSQVFCSRTAANTLYCN